MICVQPHPLSHQTLPGLFYTRVFNTPVNSQGQYAFRGPTVAYRWSARLDGILNLEGTVTLAAGTNNIDISTNAVVTGMDKGGFDMCAPPQNQQTPPPIYTASSNSPLQAGFQSARAASSSVSSPPVSNVSLTLVKHFGVTARLEGNPNPPPNGVALLGDALARYQQQGALVAECSPVQAVYVLLTLLIWHSGSHVQGNCTRYVY